MTVRRSFACLGSRKSISKRSGRPSTTPSARSADVRSRRIRFTALTFSGLGVQSVGDVSSLPAENHRNEPVLFKGPSARECEVRGRMNPFLSCKGCVPAIQLFKPPSQLHPAWQATIQCLQSRLWILRKDNIWQIIRGLNITTLQLGNRSSYRSRSVHHRSPSGDENHHDDK